MLTKRMSMISAHSGDEAPAHPHQPPSRGGLPGADDDLMDARADSAPRPEEDA